MYPKFNLFCYYPQFNHMYAPKYFDWVTDGSGELNFWVDDYIKHQPETCNGRADIAMLIEPRTIQPTLYEYVENHPDDFNLIFSHDEEILKLPNAYPIYFMNWYKSYDIYKTKPISMVCSDKAMCDEHRARQQLAEQLGDRVDHYGMFKGGRYCDYYECRAEYMFEVVVDNNWSGYWLSEKLANPLASKTVPIYLGGKHIPDDIDTRGMIIVNSVDEIPKIVDKILRNLEKEYYSRAKYIDHNYEVITRHYHVFEDWFYEEYSDLLNNYASISIISNNCVGGALLHDLGLQYQSPTVDLQIMPEEYPKFCKYINDYIQCELIECKPENLSGWHRDCLINMYGEIPPYPLALCGDILICFRHYNSYEEGRDKWNARRKRFDPEHIGYIFYVMDKKYYPYLYEFIECDFPNAVVFTENFNTTLGNPYVITPERKDGFLDTAENGKRYFEQNFNPAEWIRSLR